MTLLPVTVVQLSCVVVASLGLMTLVGAMIRFEQRRPGGVGAVVLGSALLLMSTGVVLWESWTA